MSNAIAKYHSMSGWSMSDSSNRRGIKMVISLNGDKLEFVGEEIDLYTNHMSGVTMDNSKHVSKTVKIDSILISKLVKVIELTMTGLYLESYNRQSWYLPNCKLPLNKNGKVLYSILKQRVVEPCIN